MSGESWRNRRPAVLQHDCPRNILRIRPELVTRVRLRVVAVLVDYQRLIAPK